MRLIVFVGVFLHLYLSVYACNTPCSGANQILEQNSCICKCLDQYEPSFDGKTCLPKCNVACLSNSRLDKDTCTCVCLDGFQKAGDVCVALSTTTTKGTVTACNRVCGPYEDFFPSTCECRCKSSAEFYNGECIPICNICNCPANSYIEKKSCQCLCNPGYYKDFSGNCLPQTTAPPSTTTASGCTKSCNGQYEVLRFDTCTCECGTGYERYNGQCVPLCHIPCPANSYLEKKQCACVCNDGYYKDNNQCVLTTTPKPSTTTAFTCNKVCLDSEVLDAVNCICKPRCTKVCLSNSYLDTATCTCQCKPGYYKSTTGMCLKITTTQPTTTISLCTKSCAMVNEVLDVAACSCVCAKNYERYNGECVPVCSIPCPANSYLNKKECACVCNDGFYKQNGFCVTSTTAPTTTTAFTCSKTCGDNEILNRVNCVCTCAANYEYNSNGTCVPVCNKVCLINSVLDKASCSCICLSGYYRDSAGSCVPSTPAPPTTTACTRTCGINEIVDITTCTCRCRDDCEMYNGGCIPKCNLACLENSSLDKPSCSCICNNGYYKEAGICVPVTTTTAGGTISFCNKSCDADSEYLDASSCSCKKKY